MDLNLKFVPIDAGSASEISKWKYDGFLKEIGMEAYFENLEKTGIMKGPAGCDGYAAVDEDGRLIGLFEYYFVENGIMEIGLALNPEMVGKGFGVEFVRLGIEFGISRYDYKGGYVRLGVNAENVPAVKVYEKYGFEISGETVGNDGSKSYEMRKYL